MINKESFIASKMGHIRNRGGTNPFSIHFQRRINAMKSILIKDTTREERQRIVHQALWGACGIDCEFCSGCDNRGGGRIENIYQPYIDGLKEIREINEEYNAPFVRG